MISRSKFLLPRSFAAKAQTKQGKVCIMKKIDKPARKLVTLGAARILTKGLPTGSQHEPLMIGVYD